MNKFVAGAITFGVVLVIILVAAFTGLSWVGVGSIGIVKHMDGKVTEVPQGIHWTGWGVSVQEYPTYMQSLVLSDSTKEGGTTNQQWTVGTSDQQELPVNTNLTWKITTKDVAALYQTVGGKDIDYISSNIVLPTMKNVTNKITHKYSWNSVKGSDQATITEEINAELGKQLLKSGIEIGTFGFTFVGSPQGMAQSQQALATSELNIKKAAQEQDKAKIENQTKILNAETDAQTKLIQAEGEAKANTVLSASLNANLIEYKKVDKWDGKNPSTVVGQGSSTSVMVK